MKLKMNEVTYLAKRYPQASTISLFSTTQTAIEGTEEETLKQKGILKDGSLTQDAKRVFDIIAKATQASRLIVRDGLTLLEKYTYRVGEDIALVENQGEDVELSLPENFSLIGYEVSQYIGTSARKTTGIEMVLPVDEAMVLLALIDLYRQYAILAYLDQDVADVITIDEIQKHISKKSNSSLMDLFRANSGYSAPEDIEKTIGALMKKDCVTKNGGYRLSAEYALFAKNFLVPSTMILVESYSIGPDGVLSVGGGIGLTADVCDQAFFLTDTDEVEMKAVAGLEMIKIIEGFLACPVL